MIRVGVFDTGVKGHAEVAENAVRRALNFFPSLINWQIDCPGQVIDLSKAYSHADFCESAKHHTKPQYPPCKLGSADKSQLLEAINLSLFDLNNENMDQNLKKTGHQLLVLSAGAGFWRINAAMLRPTKSRVLLGGTPVRVICLQPRPPFQTPLLIRCCDYSSPF